MTTMRPITIPDLDNDTLTYRFSRNTERRGPYNEYFIERSINGGRFETIGTVRQTAQGDWSHSSQWTALAKGEPKEYEKGVDRITGIGTTRKDAVRSLEHSLQPKEYAERKRAEYLAREAEQRRLEQEELEARRARVRRLYSDLPLLGVFGGYITIERLIEDAASFGVRSYTPEQVIDLLEFLAKP